MKKSNIYIIAEIGINHNGSIQTAKKLILDAKDAGASAAKFQVFETETLGRPKMKKNLDQIKNSKKNIVDEVVRNYLSKRPIYIQK